MLIGPSGCGKSTVLRMINRLIEPTAGRILLGDEDVTRVDPVELRRRIGYVIQNVGLFPHQTVRRQRGHRAAACSAGRSGAPAERVDELLDLVGLDPAQFGRRYPHELSGGQRQRVGVARALAADPVVLLMDEPFSAVDPIVRTRLQEEFLRLQAEVRKTIVLVTHDLDEAVRLGDRIAVLSEGGQLEQYDSPADAARRTRPRRSSREFVGADRGISGWPSPRSPGRRWTRCPADDAAACPRCRWAASGVRRVGACCSPRRRARLVVTEDGRPVGGSAGTGVLGLAVAADPVADGRRRGRAGRARVRRGPGAGRAQARPPRLAMPMIQPAKKPYVAPVPAALQGPQQRRSDPSSAASSAGQPTGQDVRGPAGEELADRAVHPGHLRGGQQVEQRRRERPPAARPAGRRRTRPGRLVRVEPPGRPGQQPQEAAARAFGSVWSLDPAAVRRDCRRPRPGSSTARVPVPAAVP